MSKQSRRKFLKTLCTIGASTGALSICSPEIKSKGMSRYNDTQNKKPNFLFIITDQQTMMAMSAYGNKYLRTPAMDSLAATGVRFENSYCTSPICGPSRSSLVTGRMPHETGVRLNGDSIKPEIIPNMGQIFSHARYQTVWAGKWHLPVEYPQDSKDTPGFKIVLKGINRDPQGEVPLAQKCVNFIKSKHDNPFLLVASFTNPHDICYWIREHSTPTKHKNVDSFPPLPDNFKVDPNEPEFVKMCRERKYYRAEIRYTIDWTKDHWRAYLDAYYRYVEKVDKALGLLLDGLRESGLEKDTVVIFTSDHGEGVAAHQWVVKLMLYEEPVKVPIILSWKGVPPAGVNDEKHLVSGLDVLPTMCDYAGLQCPSEMRGQSLRSIIENPEMSSHDFVVSELVPFPKNINMQGRMLRTKKYKYIVYNHGKRPEQLYDLESDPGESHNLSINTNLA